MELHLAVLGDLVEAFLVDEARGDFLVGRALALEAFGDGGKVCAFADGLKVGEPTAAEGGGQARDCTGEHVVGVDFGDGRPDLHHFRVEVGARWLGDVGVLHAHRVVHAWDATRAEDDEGDAVRELLEAAEERLVALLAVLSEDSGDEAFVRTVERAEDLDVVLRGEPVVKRTWVCGGHPLAL